MKFIFKDKTFGFNDKVLATLKSKSEVEKMVKSVTTEHCDDIVTAICELHDIEIAPKVDNSEPNEKKTGKLSSKKKKSRK